MKKMDRIEIQNKKIAGLTLIALLIILAVVAVLLILLIRNTSQNTFRTNVDKTSAQMQQILNAGMAFYVTNGGAYWPGTQAGPHPGPNSFSLVGTNDLQPNYLPVGEGLNGAIENPWGQPYTVAAPDRQTIASNSYNPVTKKTTTNYVTLAPSVNNTYVPSPFFYVYTMIPAATNKNNPATASAQDIANAIAGTLPNSYTSSVATTPSSLDSGLQALPDPDPANACTSTSNCYVVAAVNIPGLNMSNATSAKQAQIYRNGDCVPQPVCPNDVQGNSMQPQITLIPTSVSGKLNPSPDESVSALTSFTAYAINDLPGQAGKPPQCLTLSDEPNAAAGMTVATGPQGNVAAPCTDSTTGEQLPTGRYWRVCLQVKTTNGELDPTSTEAANVNLIAVVNCIVNSPTQPNVPGSSFTINSSDIAPP